VFAVRVSPGGLTAAPDAPPASDNAPATPNTVKAFVRPLGFQFLRFEFCLPCDDMVEDPIHNAVFSGAECELSGTADALCSAGLLDRPIHPIEPLGRKARAACRNRSTYVQVGSTHAP
jgi:hypothetical protein